ncbi:MAG: TolC family protein [Verrucomicrobiota bacterium]
MTQEEEIPNPLTWRECVQLALRHNVRLQVAETQLERAEGAKFEFRSRVLPQVSGTAITFPPLVILDVRQMVFDQRAILAWEASNLANSVSRLNYEMTLNQQMMQLRLAYLNVLFLQEQQKISRRVVKFLETRQQNAQAMFESGQMRRAEVQQVEVRLALVRDALLSLDNLTDNAKIELLEVMGTGVRMGQINDVLEVLPARPVDRSKASEMALSRLPEIRLLEKLAEGSVFQARIARAETLPNVYMFGRAEFSPGLPSFLADGNRTEDTATTAATATGAVVAGVATGTGTGAGTGTGTTIDPTTDTTGLNDVDTFQEARDEDDEFEKSRALFGLQVQWLVFDGGASEGEAIRRDQDAIRARTTAQQLRQELPGQVEEAWQLLESSRKIMEDFLKMPDLESALAMAQDEYEGNRAGQNETLAFALDSAQVQSRLLRAQYESNIALTILRRVTGQMLAFAQDSGN